MIEHALLESLANGVAPPYRLAVDHGGIGAHMLAEEQRHPHMAGLERGAKLLGGFDNFTAAAHAAHIVDRFAEDGEFWWHNVVRRSFQSLGFADEQLVVEPAMVRIALIGQLVVSGNDDIIRARDRSKILIAPGISFYDRHRYATRRHELPATGRNFPARPAAFVAFLYNNFVPLMLILRSFSCASGGAPHPKNETKPQRMDVSVAARRLCKGANIIISKAKTRRRRSSVRAEAWGGCS